MIDLYELPGYGMPAFSLIQVAALTPDDVEMEFIDDAIEPVDYDDKADMVAFTAITCQIDRVYEMAREFKKRGKTVVMGGLHVSARQEEALEYADAIVIGEAEGGAWTDLVQDFRDGKLKQKYQNEEYPDLNNLPWPRRDLLKADKYETVNLITASRGCPIGCSFCSVSRFYGPKYRFRPAEQVAEEMKSISTGGYADGQIYFNDDNVVFNRRYSKELFRAIIDAEVDRGWWGFSSIDIGKNDELLDLAVQAGCESLFVGIETINQTTLKRIHKGRNLVEAYTDSLQNISDHGIETECAFLFGFDEDGPDVFENSVEFALHNGVNLFQCGFVTPYPGTPLEADVRAEGRIIEDMPYSYYNGCNILFEPKNMSMQELYEGFIWAYETIYSPEGIERRMKNNPKGFELEYNLEFADYINNGLVSNYNRYKEELGNGPWVHPR
jgi:radical SAM superfamily enzyme YgiQ (UPF0313 family)